MRYFRYAVSQLKFLFWCVLVGVTPSSYAFAQRDAPVWESYIASTTITHGENSSLDFQLLFKKEGGPYEHTEHQMYLIGYLKKDEREVLRLAGDKSLLDKTKSDANMFLDVLKERQLVTVIATKVGKRADFFAQDNLGKYRDGSKSDRGKASLQLNTFPFRFSVKNMAIFDAISKLKNFDTENVVGGETPFYKDKFRILLFVPVNDCKYATDISKDVRSKHDFANYNTDIEDGTGLFYLKTPLLYFKPLSFEFNFLGDKDDKIRIHIN